MSEFSVTPSTDRFTGFQITVSGDHAYIHRGKGFSAMGGASLAANANYGLTITTPAANVKYVHFRPALLSSSASYVKATLYEAPTFTAGTAGTPINRNRNSTTVAASTYAFGATYTSGGTIIDIAAFGGGVEGKGGGQSSGAEQELVLKPSTTYLLWIQNPSTGATTQLVWNLFWYEEDAGV